MEQSVLQQKQVAFPPPAAPFSHFVVDPAHPAALKLLGEVLARLAGVDKPVVQFIATAEHIGAGQVALEFAIASARQFGKTLLVSSGDCARSDVSGARELSWRMTQMLGGANDGVMPDAVISGLYHSQPPQAGFPGGQPPIASLQAAPRDFRMIVLDAPHIGTNPKWLASAQGSSGCVLSVAAGQTRQTALLALQRQLNSAGVTMLGTVLYDAPTIRLRLPWQRRAA